MLLILIELTAAHLWLRQQHLLLLGSSTLSLRLIHSAVVARSVVDHPTAAASLRMSRQLLLLLLLILVSSSLLLLLLCCCLLLNSSVGLALLLAERMVLR